MKILHIKKLYAPALSIVAMIFLLLVLISISTYRNIGRQKTVALETIYRQGLALIFSLEAGARTGMKALTWQEISLGNLIRETAKNKEIAYVFLIDGQGIISHHSEPSKEDVSASWHPNLEEKNQVVKRIRTFSDGTKTFELAKFFSPMYDSSILQHRPNMMVYGETVSPHSHRGNIVVIGMKMTAFEAARRADIQHGFIMAAILLLLGSGALFFVFVIHNYYLVDRTLKQTKDYTRQVVASLANGLLSIDTDGRIVSYNTLALKFLDLNESAAQGLDLKTIIDFQKSGIHNTLSEGQSILEKELHFQKKSSEIIPLSLSVTPIVGDKGSCQGAVLELRDLSELKQLEEKVKRSEKLAAIGKLAAGVAHEIRNPLSSIRGFAQFLKHALKDRPKDQEYAATMVEEVDRINKVVTDLLTFARPLEAELFPTQIGILVEHTIRLVLADAASRNIEIAINKPANINEVQLDSNQMTQALLNLLLNALQAVEPGGRIEVGIDIENNGTNLCLWVQDDGSGIEFNEREKIFEPFFTKKEQGTGIGLSIVHKIAENHQGQVTLQSPPPGSNRGSRFTIVIPFNLS